MSKWLKSRLSLMKLAIDDSKFFKLLLPGIYKQPHDESQCTSHINHFDVSNLTKSNAEVDVIKEFHLRS